MPAFRPLLERISDMTDKSPTPDGCWRWTGSRCRANGYGKIGYACPYRRRYIIGHTHRALMEHALGRQLRRDELVLHRPHCGRDCVNPAHLRVGTAKENTADARLAGRLRSRFLKPWQVRMIVCQDRMGMTPAKITERSGVSFATVQNILKGRTHAKITRIGRTRHADSAPTAPLRRQWAITRKPRWQRRGVLTHRAPDEAFLDLAA